MKFKITLLFILSVLVSKMGVGQVSGTYNFASVTTTSGTTDPTTVPTATGVTFGSFTSSIGTNSGASGRFSFTGWPLAANAPTSSGNATCVCSGSINTSSYYQVSITVASGYTVSLSSLKFTLQRSATGIRQYSVRSNADAYASNLSASISPTNSNLSVVTTDVFQVTDATTAAQTGNTITLSGADYTNLSSGTTRTFRFYGWNAEASGGTFSIDDVVISGTVTAAATAPSAPTISSITPGNQQLSVAFTAGSDGGSAITNYKYSTDNGSSYTAVSPAATTSPIVITGLTNSTSYNVKIRAVNTVGDGTESSASSGTPRTTPAAPTISSITSGDQQLSVAFTAGSDGGSAITTYKFSTNGGANWQTRSAGTTASPLVISTLSTDGTTALTNGVAYDIQIRAVNAAGDGTASSTTSGTPVAPVSPTLNANTLSSALSSTYGAASAGVSFTASGSNLSANITATAQSGYQVSTDNSSFGSSVSIASGTTVYVRFASTISSGSYNSATAVVLSGGGSSSNANVSTSVLGNTVSQKALTVSGLTAQNKVYDGLTIATTAGAAVLSGVIGADAVSLSGSPTFTFDNATVGTSKTVNTTGYSLTGSQAGNYTLTQPILSANITVRTLTLTANNVSKVQGVLLSGGAGSTEFTSSGLQNSETVGSVTIAYGTAGATTGDGNTVGVYASQVTPSAATGGTFTASNYSITYVEGSITVLEAPVAILQWNTFGNTGTETTEPSVFNDPNIASTNLTQGSITPAGNSNRFGGSNWWNTGNSANSTLANAIAGNDYIQFIVTPNSGSVFTPTSFVFNWDKSVSGPQNVALRSSVDNFANDLGTISPTAAIGTSNTITISGLSNIATATTFRVYGYGGTATNGTGGFDVGSNVVNVQLNGYVKSVPQLSTPTATTISTSSATLGATITSNGGETITSRGTVYGTTALPTTNSLAEGGTSVAAYSHARTSLIANTLYFYRGYAVNTFGTGYSPEGTFTTIHNAPTIEAGSNATSTTIDANWSAPAAGGSAAFTYQIQVDNNSDFSSPEFTQSNIASSSTTITTTGLVSNTTYYYRVRANNDGGSSAWSSTSNGYATLIVVNPTLSATALTAFGTICLNETSSANSFTINGSALTTADVTVSALSGYTFSETLGGTYTGSLSLPQAGGSYSQTVYVKFTPAAVQSYNGNIVISGGGAISSVDVAASGGGTVGVLSLTTAPVSSLTYQGGISGGSSISVSCGTIAEKGIVYSSTANPTLSSTFTTDGSGIANYTSSINLLSFSSGQIVYYRAYATTSNGLTNYGNELSLIVPASPCSDMFISEYVEGSSNNKYIELYNPTSGALDLSNYSLRMYANGSPSNPTSTALSGTLPAKGTLVLRNSAATAFTGASVVASALNFNGDDAIALAKNGVNIDVFGQIGTDPGTAWTSGTVSTLDKTLRRKFSTVNGDDNGSNVFNPSLEWEVFSIDDVSDLGKFYSPTASNQSFCAVNSPTVSNLTTTSGSNIQWYTAATGGSALTSVSSVASGTYYVSQIQGACESSRGSVTIAVDNLTLTVTPTTGDFIWNGRTNSNFGINSNWYEYNGSAFTTTSAIPSSSTNIIIPANESICVLQQPTTLTNGGNVKNLTIESGASLTMQSGTLSVAGNWENNGTFTPGTGTVALIGTSDQSIVNSAGETFHKLTINKALGVVLLSNDVTIANELNLTSGIVDLQASNLNMASNAINGGSVSSYVRTSGNGVLKRDVSTLPIVFPVGKSAYNPAILTNSGDADLFSLRVYDYVSATGAEGGVQTSGQTVNRTWMISESLVGGSDVTLKMYWNAGEEFNGFIYSPGSMNVMHHNGSIWEELGATNQGDSPYFIEKSQVLSFSPFTIGYTGSPLPVEFLEFTAKCNESSGTVLNWSTASEHNSDYFKIEKSIDGINWFILATVAAAGNSTERIDYTLVDNEKSSGAYYKLWQYDVDGSESFLAVVHDDCSGNFSDAQPVVYPNPTTNNALTIQFNDDKADVVKVEIYSLQGKLMYSQTFKGAQEITITDLGLDKGIYQMTIQQDGKDATNSKICIQ